MIEKKQVKSIINIEENKIFDLLSFSSLNALSKLRLIVGLIFLLMTFSIILVFLTASWIPIVLVIISYILILVLTIKLFLVKKL
jgi:hypothetical protein